MFSKEFLIDAGERIVWTAIQAFAATWLAVSTDIVGGSVLDALKISGLAALAAACKAVIATKIGDSNTAQALPGMESSYIAKPSNT